MLLSFFIFWCFIDFFLLWLLASEVINFSTGQVARALAIFNVDEVVIFNDNPAVKVRGSVFEGVTKKTNANVVLARILQYLETPQ